MGAKSNFGKIYKRLVREGILKAALCGLLAGASAMLIVSVALWASAYSVLWACIVFPIVAGLLVGALTAVIFYYKLFRPTSRSIARRLDQLGLDERAITMLDLRQDTSFIAARQREDAKKKMAAIDASGVSLRFSKALLAVALVIAVVGLGMTSVSVAYSAGVSVLAAENLIPPAPPVYIEVIYAVEGDEGGYIEGEAGPEQIVLSGESTQLVIAVAEDGWMFNGWDDGETSPSRSDQITEAPDGTVIFTAQFVQIDDSNGNPDGDSEGEPGDEGENGDQSGDQPSDNPGNPGDGGEGDQAGEPSNGAGAGIPGDGNNIIDGNIPYRDPLQQEYLERLREYLENNEDIPPELREFIEDYFDTIE